MVVEMVLLVDRGAHRLVFAFCAAAEVVMIRAYLCSSLNHCLLQLRCCIRHRQWLWAGGWLLMR